MQVAERRVSRSEVVERQRDTPAVQVSQASLDLLGVLHEHTLGDLDRQPGRIDAVTSEGLVDRS
jgi:hypothetical protein